MKLSLDAYMSFCDSMDESETQEDITVDERLDRATKINASLVCDEIPESEENDSRDWNKAETYPYTTKTTNHNRIEWSV